MNEKRTTEVFDHFACRLLPSLGSSDSLSYDVWGYMGISMRTAILGLVLTVMSAGIAVADCGDAVDQYNSAISDIEYELSRFTRCVAGSEAQDDCSSEFRRLRNAHSEYEGAVSAYRDECDQ